MSNEVKLVLANGQHQFSSAYSNTILQAAKQAGVELPYGWVDQKMRRLRGYMYQGKCWMKYNELLTESDIKKGMVLTCTGFPVYENVELDFDRN